MLYIKNHLGCFYPYYGINSEDKIVFADNIGNAIKEINPKFIIDDISVLEVLNNNYMFGDRTILKEVCRTPWMSDSYDEMKREWNFNGLPKHGYNIMPESEIADKLFELLCEELKEYIGNHKKIGILLSGGMDSRMLAGVLQYLIENGQIQIDEVVAYTWGNKNSRDVVYAERITKLFNWKWKHYVVTAEDIWNNIKIAGERGCEYTGFHLHAIPRVSEDIEVDVILAGSYGDSIGRAEYSGVKLQNLSPIDYNFNNPAYLIRNKNYHLNKKYRQFDIEKYYVLFPREKPYQYYEIDRQLHYMRRMLNPCMEILNEKAPLYQIFTHPKVFGFMWSLHPHLRNDNVYKGMLNKFEPKLANIPWARTGLKFGSKEGIPDNYKKSHHSYPKYVQEDLIDKIEYRLMVEYQVSDTLFNPLAIKKLIKLVKEKPGFNFDFLEKLLWIVSFSFFAESNNLEYSSSTTQKNSVADKINAYVLLPIKYIFLRRARKIKTLF